MPPGGRITYYAFESKSARENVGTLLKRSTGRNASVMFESDPQILKIVKSFRSAESVCAIGEFNNWSTVATPLTKTGEDEWELRLPPTVDLEGLGFFVIAEGERCGRVVSHVNEYCA